MPDPCVCLTCDPDEVIGPDAADEHETAGHDVRALPPRRGQGARSPPPDFGHLEAVDGKRVGRRRADY